MYLKIFLVASLLAKSLALPKSAKCRERHRKCTDRDLDGDWDSFRVLGGDDTYIAGSRQTVTWIYPAGSPVDAVQKIDIVSRSGAIYKPLDVSDRPDDLAGDDDGVGGISLTLPVDLPEGHYSFVVHLKTKENGVCSFETDRFTVTAFRDQCSGSEAVCTSVDSYRVCNGGAWSDDVECDGGQSCVGGRCSFQSGPGTCNPGHQRCVNATAWVQCEQDASGGWAEGDARSCSSGTECGVYLDNFIACS